MARRAEKRTKASDQGPGKVLSRGERTRARLVQAAIDEFSASGFHEAKISNIVARAGLTQPTFYIYYKTKEDIYKQLVQRVYDELLSVIERARVPASVPAVAVSEKIRTAIEVFLQYFSDNPKLAPIGYFAQDSATTIRDEIVALVARNIAFEQGAGYFRHDLDPVFVSHCYNGSLERLIKIYLLSGQYDARELSEKVANIYLYGWLPPDIPRAESQAFPPRP